MYNNIFKRTNSILQYVSDLHLEKGFKRIIKPMKKYILLGGDIGYPKENNYKKFILELSDYYDKIFVISGNHEYDNCKSIEEIEEIDKIIDNICNMRNNIFYLQKKSYIICDNYKIKLTGCTFWSELPISKYNLHINHKKWLENELEINKNYNHIIGTHHCPLYECLNTNSNLKISKYFATDQKNIIKKNNVIAWIHGHSHINKNIKIYNKNILTNQYGNNKNPLLNYKQ